MFCSRCSVKNERKGQRYCLNCHAANMREWRKTHRLTGEAKAKDVARSYANVYKRRGVIVSRACAMCDSQETEMHHFDYNRPIDVVFLCRSHHLELHRMSDSVANYARPT
jgi:hypothetical protein